MASTATAADDGDPPVAASERVGAVATGRGRWRDGWLVCRAEAGARTGAAGPAAGWAAAGGATAASGVLPHRVNQASVVNGASTVTLCPPEYCRPVGW